jgi:hypothetical protein
MKVMKATEAERLGVELHTRWRFTYARALPAGTPKEREQAAVEAEARLEANGLPVCDVNSWTLHDDAVCRALWSCRVKVEKALFDLHPLGALALTQHCLTTEQNTPIINWP